MRMTMKTSLLFLCVMAVLGLLATVASAQPPGMPVPGMPVPGMPVPGMPVPGMPAFPPAMGGFYPGPVCDRYYLPYYRFRLYLNPQIGYRPEAYSPYPPPAAASPYATRVPVGF
jgi:hypothetical protein